MKKICVVGGGNITNLRHIPAILANRQLEIIGVIGANAEAVARTARRVGVGNTLLVTGERPTGAQLASLHWFQDAELVIVGTPPRNHHPTVKAMLEAGKHVLTEKPIAMNEAEIQDLIATAAAHQRILVVMHNFQFASGIHRLQRRLATGELGRIQSFYLVQFTSRNRRLPSWYHDLPLGLFYDEASHFFYLLDKFGGAIDVLGARGQFFGAGNDSTPSMMSVDMTAGGIPAHLSINFNSPVCEWLFIVSGERKLAVYDFFRDILIVLPADGQHYALDVFRTSARLTASHWAGFLRNGIKHAAGKLYYGVDEVIRKFVSSAATGVADEAIAAERGLAAVRAMNEVADLIANGSKANPAHAASVRMKT